MYGGDITTGNNWPTGFKLGPNGSGGIRDISSVLERVKKADEPLTFEEQFALR